MDLLSTRVLVCVQLSLIILCALEESLERPSLRQSQILCNFLRLVIEIAASVLRIPVRLLVCFGVCKGSALEDFNRLARHLVATYDLRTIDEATLLTQASQDEEDLLRHDEHMLRIQKRLSRALDDASKLRRDNFSLTSRLSDVQAERASILCAVEELAQPVKPSSHSDDKDHSHMHINDRLLGSDENHDAFASVRDRFDRLEREFRDQQARCSDLERELQAFQENYRRLHEDLGRAQSSHQETKDRLRTLIQSCRHYQHTMQRMDAQRVRTIRILVVSLMVVLGLTRQLGARLARSMHAQARLLSRWRTVSSQKVSARRELIKAVYANQELRRKLDIQISRRHHHEKWQTEFHKSVRSRELAARKFKAYHQHITTRYNSTVTQLLTGLLVLWRLSLVLTQQLAEARILARALEESAIAHEKMAKEKERSELRTRVARMEVKIKAMESVDTAYLRILFDQTRPEA
ncbi:hypothetical protein EIP86_009936 [Pleurotus ostreatoroseus]|nr:hypothetical protein EIP86_009936 [Pleurotus ostreatoroseus]